MRGLLLALLLAAPLAAQYNGLGASTTTCLDKDGDKYGVGPGCLGRDADDDDPAVHTAAQATAKWGSMAAFLAHRGYSPLRTWYIATTGNDTDCGANPRDIAHPCATFAAIKSLILAGDLVFWRAGNYTERIEVKDAVTGTEANPIIYAAYPGETVTITNDTSINACAAGYSPDKRDYITIDGFILDGNIATGSEAINVCLNDHLTIRYNEARNHGRGFFGSFINDVLVEYNVSHDTNGGGNPSHTIYFGARETPLVNNTIRYNILYNPGRTCIQLNGRMSNSVIDGNWCYGYDSAAGISLEQGINHSYVRNNVVWGGNVKAFIIYDYPDQTSCGYPTIQPYDQSYNIIENNTFIGPKYNIDGTARFAPTVEIGADLEYGVTKDLGHNTFRNNVIVNYSGYQPISIHTRSTDCYGTYQTNGYLSPHDIAATTVWQNNLIYNVNSSGEVAWLYNTATTYGTPGGVPAAIDQKYTWAQFGAYNGTTTGNLLAPPQFGAYSDAWYTLALAGNFDFRPVPASPAVNAGTTTAAARDVLGHQRTVTPSIGAYQYPAGGSSIPLNSWVQKVTRGAPAPTVGWEKIVYARAAKKVLHWGAWHINSTEPNNAFLGYDVEQNRWDVQDVGGAFHDENRPESGHSTGIMWYDTTRAVVETLCCFSGSNQFENLFHTWQIDLAGQTARDVHVSPRPNFATDYQGTAAYDSANDVAIIFNSGTLYSYSPATGQYATLSPTGTCPPAGLRNLAAAYNSANGKVYFFGGYTTSYQNDIYTYTYAAGAGTCAKLSPSGTLPSARREMGFAYDSLNNVFLMAGGENGSGVLNDTWIYNPAANSWAQMTPGANFPVAAAATWETMTYDADHNVFVAVIVGANGYADGSYPWQGSQVWMYRYGGPGPSVGALSGTVSATTGSRNRVATGWARRPSLHSYAGTLYLSWEEYPAPFDQVNNWPRAYADSYSSAWSSLGTYSSICSEAGTECHDASVATVNGTPWICYYSGNPWLPRVYAKQRLGGVWTGGAIGLVHDAAGVYQSRSVMLGVGSTPYVAFIEVDKSGSVYGQEHLVYLKHFSGSWVQDGTYLNRDKGGSTYSIASSLAAAVGGSDVYVAWTEYTTNNLTTDAAPKAYVSKWSGSTLTPLGGALNQAAGTYASDVAIAYLGGQPYVAWVERTATGAATLYVKTTSDGTNWALVGSGAMNRTTGSWAFRPSLATDGTDLYLAWTEQSAIGQKVQTYAARFSSGAWASLGGSLNKSASGSAQGAVVSLLGGSPVVAWGEVNQGAYRNVYAASYSGSAWAPLGGGSSGPVAPTITSTSPLTGGTVGTPYGYQFAAVGDSPITWTATGLPSWAVLDSAGLLHGTPDASATSVLHVTATNAAGSAAGDFALPIGSVPVASGSRMGGGRFAGGRLQ